MFASFSSSSNYPHSSSSTLSMHLTFQSFITLLLLFHVLIPLLRVPCFELPHQLYTSLSRYLLCLTYAPTITVLCVVDLVAYPSSSFCCCCLFVFFVCHMSCRRYYMLICNLSVSAQFSVATTHTHMATFFESEERRVPVRQHLSRA